MDATATTPDASPTTYRIHVWGVAVKGGHRVVKRHTLTTESGARRYAERHSAGTRVTITTPTDGDPIGPPLAYYANGVEIDTPATTITTPEDTTMTAKKPTQKAAQKPAAPKAAKPTKITSWAKALDANDTDHARAYKDGRKPLTIDTAAVLKAAKSTKATTKYDTAYVRFLAGEIGYVPSKPDNTGGVGPGDRIARRAAIRAALAKITASTAKAA